MHCPGTRESNGATILLIWLNRRRSKLLAIQEDIFGNVEIQGYATSGHAINVEEKLRDGVAQRANTEGFT